MSANVGAKDIVTEGLVLYLDAANYKSYTSGSTVWRDLSNNKNNGDLINGPTFNSSNGGSIVFDGIDDHINCPYSASMDTTELITLSAWVNGVYQGINIYNEHSVLDRNGVTGYHFAIFGRKILFQTTSTFKQSNTQLSDNIWYNICATYDKTNVFFYLNGIADGNQALTGGLASSTQPITISRYGGGNLYNFYGKISCAAVYNRVLPASEILQNYNATKARFGLT